MTLFIQTLHFTIMFPVLKMNTWFEIILNAKKGSVEYSFKELYSVRICGQLNSIKKRFYWENCVYSQTVLNEKHFFFLFLQAAYDKAQKAKKAAEKRHRELDKKRQKLKEGESHV